MCYLVRLIKMLIITSIFVIGLSCIIGTSGGGGGGGDEEIETGSYESCKAGCWGDGMSVRICRITCATIYLEAAEDEGEAPSEEDLNLLCMDDCPLVGPVGTRRPDQDCIDECGGPIRKTLITKANPPGGTYSQEREVELIVDSSSCIYASNDPVITLYTTDIWTIDPPVYTAPILIDSDTKIEFRSYVDFPYAYSWMVSCSDEDIKTENYIIND